MHKFGDPQRSFSQRDHTPGVLVVSRAFWRFCSILFESKLTLSYRDENANVSWESTSHNGWHSNASARLQALSILALSSCTLLICLVHVSLFLSVLPVFYSHLTKRIAGFRWFIRMVFGSETAVLRGIWTFAKSSV